MRMYVRQNNTCGAWGIAMNGIFLVVLLLILFWGVRFAGINKYHEDYLNLDSAKAVQGVFAVLIILHHIVQPSSNTGVTAGKLKFLEESGVLFVGFFFFCSGYGVVKRYRQTDHYLKGFISKRLSSVLIPFYGITILYMWDYLGELIKSGFHENGRVLEGLQFISGVRLFHADAWYIAAIVLFYCAFYFSFRFIKKDWIRYLMMFLLMIVYIIIGVNAGHGDGSYWLQGEWWYNTVMLLFVGMLWARLEDVLLPLIWKIYYPLLVITVAGFYVMWRWNLKTLSLYGYWCEYRGGSGIPERYRTLSVQLPTIILFTFIVILLMMKLKVGNRLNRFLGMICIELYLIHRMFLQFYRSGAASIKSDNMYVLTVVFVSIVSAFLLHNLYQWIKKGCGLHIKKNKN